jgi:hypothetical protein
VTSLELQLNVNELEAKEDELQRTISGLKQQQLSELREFNLDKQYQNNFSSLNLINEIK